MEKQKWDWLVALLLGMIVIFAPQAVQAKTSDSYTLTAQLPASQTNPQVTYFDLTAAEDSVQPLTVVVDNTSQQTLKITVTANDAYTANSGLIAYDRAQVNSLSAPQSLRFSQLVQGKRQQVVDVAAGKSATVTFKVKMPDAPFSGLILGGIRSVATVGANKNNVQSQVAYNLSVVLRHNATPVMPSVQLSRVLPGARLKKSGLLVRLNNTKPNIVSQMTFNGSVTRAGKKEILSTYQQQQLQRAPYSQLNYFMPTKLLQPGNYTLHLKLTGRDGYAQTLTKRFHVDKGQQLRQAANKPTVTKTVWWPYLVGGVLAVLLMAGQVRADTTPVNNTGSGTASFDNNNYTSTTGSTYATGTASSGTALSSETGVNITVGAGNFNTFYTDNSGADSQGQYPTLDATNVANLESGSGTGSKLNVDSNGLMTNKAQAYTGGHIKVVGSLPLTATITSSLSTDQILSGNYGVMVRVQLPKDVDASKMSDAIEWDQAYFFMQLDGIAAVGGGKPTFPMQFDHHIYLDSNDKSAFYLKVKGIPITATTTSQNSSLWPPTIANSSAILSLARYSQDNLDFQHNITNSGPIKPTAVGTSASGSGKTTYTTQSDPWYFSILGLPSTAWGPIAQQGDIGWSFAVANYAAKNSSLLSSGFTGKALINFYVDVSKYKGNISDLTTNKQLTAGKLPPSARKDGLFNIGITAYSTSQMVDPYSSTAASNKGTAGKTPMDYALVKSGSTGTASTVTSNITSWNAYASPWDTKKSLNTATSAWESVGGDKTRLKNVSLDDTLTDRTVTLDALTDGIMTANATDYSGTKAPTLGAVGSNRFARAVNYFDTSTVDSNGDGALSTDKKTANATLTAKAYTAATAGVANTSSDPLMTTTTLPSLTPNTTNKNYLYYTGTTTSSAGTAIPILPAPLFFNQTNTPPDPTVKWDTSNPYIIKKSQLASGKTVTLTGTWTDDYVNGDTLKKADDKNGGTTTSTLTASSAKTFSVKVSSGSVTGALNLGSDSTVVGAHKLTVTINRPTIKLADGTTITSNANASATLNIEVVDDTVKYDITAKKYISNNGSQLTQQTVHGPTAGNGQTGDTITMVDEFTSNDKTIANPIVVATLPSQLKNVGSVTATINGISVTSTVTTANGLTYISLGKQIVKGDKVVVTYQVQATAAMPTNGLSLTDVLMDQSTYAAETNAVTLLPAPSGGIEITPPTNLEFGEHPAAPGTYNNTDGDKTLLVVDNRTTPGAWTVTAQLSNFKNAAGTRQLSGETAKLSFGSPALSSAVFTAGGAANKLVSYDFADKQTTMPYTFKNIQLQLAGTKIQPGDYNATVTYSWTNGVN